MTRSSISSSRVWWSTTRRSSTPSSESGSTSTISSARTQLSTVRPLTSGCVRKQGSQCQRAVSVEHGRGGRIRTLGPRFWSSAPASFQRRRGSAANAISRLRSAEFGRSALPELPAFEEHAWRGSSYHVEQEVEHQVNDDKKHHDSNNVSGIQGFASWTSVLSIYGCQRRGRLRETAAPPARLSRSAATQRAKQLSITQHCHTELLRVALSLDVSVDALQLIVERVHEAVD